MFDQVGRELALREVILCEAMKVEWREEGARSRRRGLALNGRCLHLCWPGNSHFWTRAPPPVRRDISTQWGPAFFSFCTVGGDAASVSQPLPRRLCGATGSLGSTNSPVSPVCRPPPPRSKPSSNPHNFWTSVFAACVPVLLKHQHVQERNKAKISITSTRL